MPSHPSPSLVFILLTLIPPVIANAGDLGTDAYRLPLVEPYAIYRSDKALSVSADRGLYQLVEVMPARPGVGISTITLVPRVESAAIQNGVIFGKAADGYFILDTRQPVQQPQMASKRTEWETALRQLGIADATVVKSPDELAAGLADRVLRPWKYRFGVADDLLSLVVQLLGIVLAFLVGLVWPRDKSPMAAAVVLGVIVNVVAQIFIAGGGPGALAGFVVLPLICILVAALGKGLRAITSSGRPTGA